MTVAPYGSWPSPVTTDLIVQASVGLGGPAFGGGDIWWSELRPSEGGRVQIVRKPLDAPPSAARDVLPEGFAARTRVHEYGGGAWWLHGETLFFANWSDQRLYRLDPGGDPVALTPEPDAPHALRYADGRLTPDGGWIVCVREAHAEGREARNQLVALPAGGPGDAVVLVGAEGEGNGPDFVSSPRVNADGTELRWLQWDHPDMPWDRTVVGRATLTTSDGRPALVDRSLTDRGAVSHAQPEYGPDGTPYVVSDIDGWWRIRIDDAEHAALLEDDDDRQSEWAQPQWVFGQSWYAFTGDGAGMVAVSRCAGQDEVVWISRPPWPGAWAAPTSLFLPYSAVDGVTAGPGRIVGFVGGSSKGEPEVVTIDTTKADDGTAAVTVHRPARDLGISRRWWSVPRLISFPTAGGATARAHVYEPTNPGHEGPGGEHPPLIVLSHGGPTAAARRLLSLAVQFWTTRGFAVVDVDYRGSTGYGRAYREALDGQWGIADVDDCIAAARHLVGQGRVDGDRLVIRGGSAGGYTTLRALTTVDDFAAGTSLYGVADLEALAEDTHKFESRYTDRLVGPYPAERETYVERSPIHHTDRLTTPLLILQGLEDEIVPPAQAEMLVDALKAAKIPHAYLAFEGEQHGFRQATTIRRALGAELYFYGRVLGFEPADDLEPVPIEFL